MHAPHLDLPVTIAAARGLRNGVQPGERANGRPKTNIDARLDQLRAHADRRRFSLKALFELLQNLHPVGRAHARAEVRHRRIARARPALLKDRKRFALCIYNDQTTSGSPCLADALILQPPSCSQPPGLRDRTSHIAESAQRAPDHRA